MRHDRDFRGTRVSHAWAVLLPEVAERVDFRLNSGRRTRPEQERLIREKGVWSPANPTGAARYSPSAPHIRAGREDHALDLDTNVGDGEAGVQRELARLGLATVNPIPQEPWHLEAINEDRLLEVAAQVAQRRDVDVLGPRTRAWAIEYIRLRRARRDLRRRRVLRGLLLARRAAEWRAARRGPAQARASARRRYEVLRRVTG